MTAALGTAVSALPLVTAAGYLVYLSAHFRRIITDVHLNPDASWAPVLARDLGTDGRGGHILVGAASHFTTIWFLVLTRWIPFRDAVWDAAPSLLYLAGLGCVAWAAWRVAGRWPALLTVVLGVGANAIVLLTVMSEGIHGATYVADGLLVAYGVYWRARSPGHRWRDASAGAAMAVVAGTTLASDTLFLACGLGPFVGAAVVVWLARRDRRSAGLAGVAAGVAAGAAVVAVVANRAMTADGFERTYQTGGYRLTSGAGAQRNLAKFGRQLQALGNGTFSIRHLTLTQGLHLVMTIGLVAAVATALFLAGQALRRRGDGADGRDGGDGRDGARAFYLTYWVLSGLAVCTAFSVTTFAQGPSDPSRYVAPAFFALAATAPLAAARAGWRRCLVALLATLFCALSINERQGLYTYEVFGRPAVRARVIDYLRAHGVDTGYTGYFDSHPLTLQAGMQVHFYPVVACRSPASARLCPFFINSRSVWYLPRPGIRTFVLFDANSALSVASIPTPDMGVPVAQAQFGQLYVFIYDHDVAAQLAPPCPASSPNRLSCPTSPA